MQKIKIIGCGSRLMGDDAVGCIVAAKLKEENLPDNIRVIEAGTPGLDLLNMMEPDERVIIVDAVITGEANEGTIRIFTGDKLPKPKHMPVSAHQIAIPETLALGRNVQPELMPDLIEIWGIEIKDRLVREPSDEMSEIIKKASVLMIEKIKNEIIQGCETHIKVL
jgi:hydrogenase maturation protease